MRVTPRGYALLVVAVLLLVAGFRGRYPLAGVLGATLLGAVLSAVVTTRGSLRITVRRTVYPSRVTRDRPALARLEVTNPGTRRQAPLTATDQAGPVTRTVQVRALLPGAGAVLHYELPTGVRGKWPVGPLTLERRDAFGLARNTLTAAGETTTLWVHPRRVPARVLFGGQRRHHHEGAVTDSALRGSVELTDVREYVPGDEVRLLHWKATARTGRLMVRDLADPQRSRFTVLLDTRSPASGADRFEELVETAASLLGASVGAGQHTSLLTSSGLRLTVEGTAEGARRLLDALSEVARDDRPVDLPEWRGGTLVVVCGAGPGLVPAGWLRHRFTQVHVVAMNGPLDVPGARMLRAETAGDAVRRWNEATG
ncbi:DUF58 domain-containing protein [Actinoplanes friuliensis]|uniref:DUF58 domain-containing protein n=1 Tax=Actinoplanes friuliensis DSM 7358 TaxID=1246995 RepID=U5W7H2_9ACTN|nr:DUF58 domain-containing protein [Actinoplanes friuliensis]AGZ43901.1 hypothetical protein AFR_28200 [Actinoplanes friuliensis DSM 7358]